MTARLSEDERIDRSIITKMNRDMKESEKMERREAAADEMIGELADGRCYVWPVGGRYREGNRVDLIAFLIRNDYV